MRFEGIHHVTCITGDAPGNVDFYTRVLGLRMVKKTVNQDDPTVYHLFYADEDGSPGSDITFFEYPGARRGRAGAGMVHTITFRVASDEALEFWEARLGAEGISIRRSEGRLGFDDPEGLGLELAVVATADAPLVARHPDVPAGHALQGFDGVRAFADDPEASRELLEGTLGFVPAGNHCWEARGAVRGGHYAYDPPPATGSGAPGAGTVHHVAWSSNIDEQDAWLETVRGAGAPASGVIDRFWFRSIYFREPSGVLFEIATMGPGFGIDEEADHLGEALILPPAFEHLRAEIEPVLTPLPDPRAGWAAP
jgi:glyoxalase family protein